MTSRAAGEYNGEIELALDRSMADKSVKHLVTIVKCATTSTVQVYVYYTLDIPPTNAISGRASLLYQCS